MENERKVIFLGAGASKDAGYPLASELFASLKNQYDQNIFDCTIKKCWEGFSSTLEQIKKAINSLDKCNDIEILMTALLLMQKTYKQLPTIDKKPKILVKDYNKK